MNTIPVMVSASDLQRSTARIMKMVNDNDQILVLNNNKPKVAMINVDKYQALLNRIQALEEQSVLEAIRIGELEFKTGKLKTTADFSEFLKND